MNLWSRYVKLCCILVIIDKNHGSTFGSNAMGENSNIHQI